MADNPKLTGDDEEVLAMIAQMNGDNGNKPAVVMEVVATGEDYGLPVAEEINGQNP